MWLSTLVSFNSILKKKKKSLVEKKTGLTMSFWSLHYLFPFKTFCSAFPFLLNYILWSCLYPDPNPFLQWPYYFCLFRLFLSFPLSWTGCFHLMPLYHHPFILCHTEFEDVIETHRGIPMISLIYVLMLWDYYLQCKPHRNLSDLLKVRLSLPWNLWLYFFPTLLPKSPGF